MRGQRSLLGALALVLLAGCSATEWTWGDGGIISAAPLRVGDHVLVAQNLFDVKFSVTALDWQTGEARWMQPAAGWSPCTGLYGDSGGAFAVCGNVITALDPTTGTIRWRTELAGRPSAPPILTDEGILVRLAPPGSEVQTAVSIGPDHGRAIRSDGTLNPATTAGQGADDSALVWRWMAGYPPSYAWLWMAMDDVVGVESPRASVGAPASPEQGDGALWPPLDPLSPLGPTTPDGLWIEDPPQAFEPSSLTGGIYDPDPDGGHLAVILSRETGEERLHVRGSSRGPLAWVGGQVIWVTPGRISAVSADHGTLTWQQPTMTAPGAEGQVRLIPGTTTVYAASVGQVLALEAFDGDLRWSLDTTGRVAPLLAPEHLIYLEGGKLKAVFLTDGSLAWWLPAPGVIDQPLLYGGAIYLKTVSGDVICVALGDGALRWRVPAGVSGAPFMVDESYRWVEGRELKGLSLEGEVLDAIPLPGPGLAPEWLPPADLASLAPVVRGEQVLLRLDARRVALLEP